MAVGYSVITITVIIVVIPVISDSDIVNNRAVPSGIIIRIIYRIAYRVPGIAESKIEGKAPCEYRVAVRKTHSAIIPVPAGRLVADIESPLYQKKNWGERMVATRRLMESMEKHQAIAI